MENKNTLQQWYQENIDAHEARAIARENTKGKLLGTLIGFACVLMAAFGFQSLVFAEESVDIEPPSDVENVEAQSGDGNVYLTWDVATDNMGVDGYKIYYGLDSVTEEGGEYFHEVEVGDVIDYLVENLENDVTYYFAVTAYDEMGNESENYSFEAEATPHKAQVEELISDPVPLGDDGKAPTVRAATSYSNVQAKVTFSEPVQLPAEEPQTAFLIQDNLTGEFLPLLDAEILNDEPNSVVLETAPQEIGIEYILTAGLTVEDEYGNSVRSGTSDTATFIGGSGDYRPINVDIPEVMETEEGIGDAVEPLDEGVDSLSEGLDNAAEDMFAGLSPEERAELEAALEEAVASGDITGAAEPIGDAEAETETADETLVEPSYYTVADGEYPDTVESLEMLSEDEVQIIFSEPVEFIQVATDDMSRAMHFVVMNEEGDTYEVRSEELDAETDTAVFTVEGLKPGKDYILSMQNIVTVAGAVVDTGDGILFEAPTLELADVIPPEEITNLMSRIEGSLVRLTWTVSVSEDAVEQAVYQSTDGEAFDLHSLLPPLVSEIEINGLAAGMSYWFKITSTDAVGNESEGVTVKVTLPETGPGLALMFGISALGTAAARRRKKRS